MAQKGDTQLSEKETSKVSIPQLCPRKQPTEARSLRREELKKMTQQFKETIRSPTTYHIPSSRTTSSTARLSFKVSATQASRSATRTF